MKRSLLHLSALGLVLFSAACATEPYGSTYAAMPSPYKPPQVFNNDDEYCRSLASQRVAGQADRANQGALLTTLLGAAIGAGIGEAVGGGREVTGGAVAGALTGGAIGVSNSSYAQYGIQRQYDIAYQQCMYSRGNQVATAAPYRPRGYGYGAPVPYSQPGYGSPYPQQPGYGAPYPQTPPRYGAQPGQNYAPPGYPPSYGVPPPPPPGY